MQTQELVFINGRSLYEKLNLRKPFSNWIGYRVQKLNLKEGKDYFTFHTGVKKCDNELKQIMGRPRKEYMLTLESASKLTDGDYTLLSYESSALSEREVLIILKDWRVMDEEIIELQNQVEEWMEEIQRVQGLQAVPINKGTRGKRIVDPTQVKAARIESISNKIDAYLEKIQDISDKQVRLNRGILKLGHEERKILTLRFYEKKDWYCIAQELNLSERYCQKILQESISKLRELMRLGRTLSFAK